MCNSSAGCIYTLLSEIIELRPAANRLAAGRWAGVPSRPGRDGTETGRAARQVHRKAGFTHATLGPSLDLWHRSHQSRGRHTVPAGRRKVGSFDIDITSKYRFSYGSRKLRPQDTSAPQNWCRSLSRITGGAVSHRNCPGSKCLDFSSITALVSKCLVPRFWCQSVLRSVPKCPRVF